MKNAMIIPASNDLNKGDQALTWRTIQVAINSGYTGKIFLLADIDGIYQSKNKCYAITNQILKHPSRKFKNKNNISYSYITKIKWGLVGVLDYIVTKPLLYPGIRRFYIKVCNKKTKETIKYYENSDAFFVKGGGFIHCSGKISDFYLIYYQLYHINLALSYNKPVFILPNSFGPFYSKYLTNYIKKIIKKCSIVSTRESISNKVLNEIGVDNILSSDLGFSLDLTNNAKILPIVKKLEGYASKKKLIGITIRPYRFNESKKGGEKYEKYLSSIKEFSLWLRKKNYMPCFIEQVTSCNKHESDIEAINWVINKLKHEDYLLIRNSQYDCYDMCKIYSYLDCLIGTRFHSVIFALKSYVPCIAITYGGNKGTGIMKDLKLEEFTIPIDKISKQQLINKFKNLLKNKNLIQKKIDTYLKKSCYNIKLLEKKIQDIKKL